MNVPSVFVELGEMYRDVSEDELKRIGEKVQANLLAGEPIIARPGTKITTILPDRPCSFTEEVGGVKNTYTFAHPADMEQFMVKYGLGPCKPSQQDPQPVDPPTVGDWPQ